MKKEAVKPESFRASFRLSVDKIFIYNKIKRSKNEGCLFMRVISGSAKSLKLKTIEGMDTRPTQDRIKETLFNMIQYDIPGCKFLDLFGGSGGIGIEALSRGAKEAVFVEKSPKALRCIRENLSFTKLKEYASVMGMDVFAAIRQLEQEKKTFDYIFMDPPYKKGFEDQVLSCLDQSSICTLDTVVIVESSLETKIVDEDYKELKIFRIKEYKTNKHTFLKKS